MSKYSQEKADHAAFVHLMSLPAVDPTRRKLSDIIRDKSLETRAAKFLTLSAEYSARRTWAKARSAPIPGNVFPSWTQRKCPSTRVASTWPSYRAQQRAAIAAADALETAATRSAVKVAAS